MFSDDGIEHHECRDEAHNYDVGKWKGEAAHIDNCLEVLLPQKYSRRLEVEAIDEK